MLGPKLVAGSSPLRCALCLCLGPSRTPKAPRPRGADKTASHATDGTPALTTPVGRKTSAHSQFGSSGSPPPASATASGFDFGSYGRVSIGSDLRGHSGHGVNVVSFGSRLENPRTWNSTSITAAPSATIRRSAGVWCSSLATRAICFTRPGIFAELCDPQRLRRSRKPRVDGLSLWAGSRMYRGDDVYLFDFWPLDNLNTVGGGAAYALNQKRTLLQIHLGMNRLADFYQFQQIQVPARRLPGSTTILSQRSATTTVTTLDRQRLVVSAKATQFLRNLSDLPNAKFILYGNFTICPKASAP